MIATLPMYDRAETRAANDRFWELVRAHLPDAPKALSRDDLHWLSPDLILSQTCSLPFRAGLHHEVTLVASPVHALPCPAGTYYSAVVVRAADERGAFPAFAGSRLAINSPSSHSGWAAIDALAQAEGLRFGAITVTGAHRESARAVAEGRADIAAIDAVSWEMIARWDEFASGLRVLLETPPTPALPFITAAGRDPEPIQDALVMAVAEMSDADRETLCLVDITYLPADRYLALPIPPVPQTVTEGRG